MVFSSFLPLYWLYLPSQGNNSALTGIFRRSQKEKTSTFTVSDESSPLESESQLFIPYVNHDQSWRRVATGVGQQWWRSRHCWTNVGSIKRSTVFISVLSELCEWGWAAGGKDWRCRRQKGSWEQNGVCVCVFCVWCLLVYSLCDMWLWLTGRSEGSNERFAVQILTKGTKNGQVWIWSPCAASVCPEVEVEVFKVLLLLLMVVTVVEFPFAAYRNVSGVFCVKLTTFVIEIHSHLDRNNPVAVGLVSFCGSFYYGL